MYRPRHCFLVLLHTKKRGRKKTNSVPYREPRDPTEENVTPLDLTGLPPGIVYPIGYGTYLMGYSPQKSTIRQKTV